MKLRTLLIVVATLAVLSAAVFLARRPSAAPSTDARLGQPIVAGSTLEQATQLRVSDQGKSVTLARQSDGTWRVTNYHDLPADFTKLTRLTDELATAKLDRLVTSNPDRIARLEFKDTKIELLDAAQKPLASVTLGKTADSGGRFLRFADEPKAYLASLNAWLDAEPKNWADPTLVNLKPEEISKIELTFASSQAPSVTFTRAKKEDPWTTSQLPANHTVATEKLTSLLSALTNLRFSDTLELTDPQVAEAKPHARTVKLTTFDNKTLTFTLTRKPESKKLKDPSTVAASASEPTSGPAALGSLTDLTKKADASTASANPQPGTANTEGSTPAKPLTPEFETIPAGPVFVSIAHTDANAPVNALMQKRAFQIYEYTFTSLPAKPDELFTPAPPPAATPTPAPAK